MAKAAEQQKEAAKERPYISSQAEWDKVKTPEYGGQSDILQIAVGEVAGPFQYQGHQPMTLDGKEITVHTGIANDSETLRLPIAASFLRAVDQADLFKGDTFLIRRGDDVKKKSGVGKGQNMQIYAIKVIKSVERPKTEGAPF